MYRSQQSIDSPDGSPCVRSPVIVTTGLQRKSLVNEKSPPSSGSRGQCSQDSGFSDSDSCSSGRQSLERQKRRRASKRKGNAEENLGTTDPDNGKRDEMTAGPAHTSTPKKEHMFRKGHDLKEMPKKLNFNLDE